MICLPADDLQVQQAKLEDALQSSHAALAAKDDKLVERVAAKEDEWREVVAATEEAFSWEREEIRVRVRARVRDQGEGSG